MVHSASFKFSTHKSSTRRITVIVNPLDPGPGSEHIAPDEIIRRQTTLLQSLLVASLNRDLTPEERTACDLALESLRDDTGGQRMTLPKVVRQVAFANN